VTARRKARERKRAAAELAQLRSLRHTDAEAYRLDVRVGAVLVGPGGVVLARRIARPAPSSGWVSMGARSLAPWVLDTLPPDHPRQGEDPVRSESALRLDRALQSGDPWL